jgi:hypothetical protein
MHVVRLTGSHVVMRPVRVWCGHMLGLHLWRSMQLGSANAMRLGSGGVECAVVG